jgi:hypothetical protein
MKFLDKQPTVKAPAETFTGDAWFDVIVRGGLDEVPDGYRAMADRQALKVLIQP